MGVLQSSWNWDLTRVIWRHGYVSAGANFGNAGGVRDAVPPLAAAAFRHTALLNCPETPVKVAHVYFEMSECYAIYSQLRFDVQFDFHYMLHCCYCYIS